MVIDRESYVAWHNDKFGKLLLPGGGSFLSLQLAKAIVLVEQLLNVQLSNKNLTELSINIELVLSGNKRSCFSDVQMPVIALLTLLNYLHVVKHYGSNSLLISGGLSYLVEDSQTCSILDDIQQQLIRAFGQKNKGIGKISTLISKLTAYDTEAAKKLEDIFDIKLEGDEL